MLYTITAVCTLLHLMLQILYSSLYNTMLQFSLHVYEIIVLLLGTSALKTKPKSEKCAVINNSYNLPTFYLLFGFPPPFPITNIHHVMCHKCQLFIKIHIWKKRFILSSQLPQTPTIDLQHFCHTTNTYRCTCESSSDTVILTFLQTSDIKDCTYFCNRIYSSKLHTGEKWLRWSRGSVLAFGTQVRRFAPDRSRRIFRAKKSSARLPSEGK
jgi:hypothetical protein